MLCITEISLNSDGTDAEETDRVIDNEEASSSMQSLNFYQIVFPLTAMLIPPL